MSSSSTPFIGISIRPEGISVAVFNQRRGLPTVLVNDRGNLQTPVAFYRDINGRIVLGELAEETVGFVGKELVHPEFEPDYFDGGEPRAFMLACLLQQMRRLAERHRRTTTTITRAYISMLADAPNWFRLFVLDACRIAGLHEVRLVNELSAVAVAAFSVQKDASSTRLCVLCGTAESIDEGALYERRKTGIGGKGAEIVEIATLGHFSSENLQFLRDEIRNHGSATLFVCASASVDEQRKIIAEFLPSEVLQANTSDYMLASAEHDHPLTSAAIARSLVITGALFHSSRWSLLEKPRFSLSYNLMDVQELHCGDARNVGFSEPISYAVVSVGSNDMVNIRQSVLLDVDRDWIQRRSNFIKITEKNAGGNCVGQYFVNTAGTLVYGPIGEKKRFKAYIDADGVVRINFKNERNQLVALAPTQQFVLLEEQIKELSNILLVYAADEESERQMLQQTQMMPSINTLTLALVVVFVGIGFIFFFSRR